MTPRVTVAKVLKFPYDMGRDDELKEETLTMRSKRLPTRLTIRTTTVA
ncbi:MAG: hypothetical protein ABSA11_06980 [Candidatus Bathyarchaeia archaeon]